jgi:hypothetical protein
MPENGRVDIVEKYGDDEQVHEEARRRLTDRAEPLQEELFTDSSTIKTACLLYYHMAWMSVSRGA